MKSLFEVEGGFSDRKVHYISGEGQPIPGESGDTQSTQNAPTGSSYTDITTGEKWTKTPAAWRKLAMVT
jgi:hypothetical protein